MQDVFRPVSEPSATIYDAFQLEAKNRNGKSPSEWIPAERHKVWMTAVAYAEKHGLHPPSIEEIEKMEKSAYGSADYGSKWSIKVANLMTAGKGTL